MDEVDVGIGQHVVKALVSARNAERLVHRVERARDRRQMAYMFVVGCRLWMGINCVPKPRPTIATLSLSFFTAYPLGLISTVLEEIAGLPS